MKISLQIVVFYILTSVVTDAQIIKGRISSQSGDPVAYATVYIQELKQGTTANAKGNYEIKLPSGKYLVTYQSLGYSPVFHEITVTEATIYRDVILTMQYYEIPEVRISATGEDPAYRIMRKAIGMAPYYLNNINYYKADVYIKGNVVFNKIPKLLQKQFTITTRNEDGTEGKAMRIKEGDLFMLESFNEVEFTAPDRYEQKVISINSTLPEQGNNISPMDLIQASFYEPLIADLAVSPLSPQAFGHYKFRYMGATPQGNNLINKIQVIPKVKSQQLFEGTIYIIEDLWCLQSVDLINDNLAGRISIRQLYIPVQDDIWMPVSHKFSINIGIMGVRADGEYASSVKYTEVRPNNSLEKPSSITSDRFAAYIAAPEKKLSKNQEKIEEMLQKDEMTNRDMVKLSRLMDRESENALPDSIRNSLEIKDNSVRKVEDDATKKDSAYWAEIRPIPLSEMEVQSIRIRDSINRESSLREVRTDSVAGTAKKEKSRFLKALSTIGFGHTWSDTSGLSFRFGGLLDGQNYSFNPVDGFVYGIDFRISKRWEDNSVLTLAPELNRAFSRESFLWRVNGSYSFNSMKQGQIFFRTGRTSSDISSGGSINTFLNTVTSLLLKKNYLKLYDSRYFFFGYRGEITNGLRIEFIAGYDKRGILANTTDYSLIKSSREYSENIPENSYLDDGADPLYELRDHKHFETVTSISYTPRQRYRIVNNAKLPQGSDWPTFELTWKHGMNESPGSTGIYKHFDMIKLQIHKEHDLGAFSNFTWRLRTGFFLNESSLTFFDFFHFNAQPLPVLIDNYQDAFRLPDYYSLSTPEFHGEAHIKYTTPYLLLKYLPGLSKTLMRENLSLSYLGSDFHGSYTEIGYSISEISLIGELGVYAGFENFKYKNTGVRLVFKLR
ncbi:MAG: carboxypeptidase-like regulatory domain-containing protein [Bacteroidales bacterium]|nr:carboxypeptidase-like regulatory domain-containing protein [Bacteroidales bacterium]